MCPENRPGDRPEDTSTKCQLPATAGNRVHTSEPVDEIVPLQQILRLQLQFQRGVLGAERAVKFDLCIRRGDFAVVERAHLRIFRCSCTEPARLPAIIPGSSTAGGVPARIPFRSKMFEVGRPCILGSIRWRLPSAAYQSGNRIVHGIEGFCQARAMEMVFVRKASVCISISMWPSSEPSSARTPDWPPPEFSWRSESPGGFNIRCVKPLIGQLDVMARKIPAPVQSPET